MIQTYASTEAANPIMWGGRVPEAEEADQLAQCFTYEWDGAVGHMLRHWETPPTTTHVCHGDLVQILGI
jgi:hypothetical protein